MTIRDEHLAEAISYLQTVMPAEFRRIAGVRQPEPLGATANGLGERYQIDENSPIWTLPRVSQEPRPNSDQFPLSDEELAGELFDYAQQGRTAATGHGIDAIAWYQQFHYYDDDHWGIYLTLEGIAYFALELLTRVPGITPFRAVQAGAMALARHEEFHYQVEIFATGQELCTRKVAYRPYFERVYTVLKGTSDHREESFANRYMVDFAWDRFALGAKDIIAELADAGPPGYCDWRSFKSEAEQRVGMHQLASEIVDGSPGVPSRPLYKYFPGRQLSTPIWQRHHVPVYIVGNRISPPWTSTFYIRLPRWRDLRDWVKAELGWYVPGGVPTHGGSDSKIWTGGGPGLGHGIPVNLVGDGRVGAGVVGDIARLSGIPMGTLVSLKVASNGKRGRARGRKFARRGGEAVSESDVLRA
jgi:hypothetical protein